jgi:hypothetical protein
MSALTAAWSPSEQKEPTKVLLTGSAGLIGMALRPMLVIATEVPTAFWQAFCFPKIHQMKVRQFR